MSNYFNECKTTEEIKETYKKLARTYHPDIYGEKGNDIMKDIHNQLERALKNVDKKGYNDLYNSEDKEESAEVRARKEEIAKQLLKQHGGLAYQYLFIFYWQNGLRPANHKNPITKHNFSGWNVWQLELKMLTEGYKSSNWSTFAQLKANKTSVNKGEHGTYITLAIVTTKKAENEEEEEKTSVYYKGYSVFNEEQTKAREEKTIKIETKKESNNVKQLNVWSDKYEVVA